MRIEQHTYTAKERAVYFIRRHVVFLALIIPSVLYLKQQQIVIPETGEVIDSGSGLIMMAVSSLLDSAVAVWFSFLILKFAMPKLHIQKEIIEEHNVAVAILVSAVVVGMAL